MVKMPRNIRLAVAWRLLLLIAVAVMIYAIGHYRFDWRLFGPKKAIEDTDEVGLIIENHLDEKLLEQKIEEAVEEELPTPEAEIPVPTPAPTPQPTPKPTPMPEKTPPVDDKGLEKFLEDEL